MPRAIVTLFAAAATLALPSLLSAQTASPNDSDAVRVTVTINPDGSHTAYQFDQPRHQATAITTGSDGKLLGKAVYRMDDARRFTQRRFFWTRQKISFQIRL